MRRNKMTFFKPLDNQVVSLRQDVYQLKSDRDNLLEYSQILQREMNELSNQVGSLVKIIQQQDDEIVTLKRLLLMSHIGSNKGVTYDD